jgi:propanol-preferring alcohol dehydrogenase
VIGAGGLGSFAIQYLKLLTGTQIIAVDINPTRLDVAKKMGAHEIVLADQSAAEKIIALTGGKGVAAVLDFVASNESLALGHTVVKPNGKIVIPGIHPGAQISFGWGTTAPGCDYRLSLGFTNKELREVVSLARMGKLTIDVERFSFKEIPAAIEKLEKGQLRGRAVIEIGRSS